MTYLKVLYYFLKYPDRFWLAMDLSRMSGIELRSVYRAIGKLKEHHLICDHSKLYYLNAEIISHLYGKKTELRKKLENGSTVEAFKIIYKKYDLELLLAKHFIADPHGEWTASELSLLYGRPNSTVQSALEKMQILQIIKEDRTEHETNRTNPINYRLDAILSANLSSKKNYLMERIQEMENV
ncbi:MAG: hypothetical protein HS129_15210 [Leptospiraceae bacterium]|nr:hypothetical protein [Leptospiraceae bacterium]NUM40836.1 hypothetical protein [Leptospiraceae bacterium]